jgi:hypothetical protein
MESILWRDVVYFDVTCQPESGKADDGKLVRSNECQMRSRVVPQNLLDWEGHSRKLERL